MRILADTGVWFRFVRRLPLSRKVELALEDGGNRRYLCPIWPITRILDALILRTAVGTTKYTKYTKTERVPEEAKFIGLETGVVDTSFSLFVCFVFFVLITA